MEDLSNGYNILDTIGLKLNLNNELLSLSFELENMFDTYIFDDEEKGYKCYYSKDSTCYIMIYEEPVDGVILDLLHSPDEQSPVVGEGYSEEGLLCCKY